MPEKTFIILVFVLIMLTALETHLPLKIKRGHQLFWTSAIIAYLACWLNRAFVR